jgi:PAS domain S-box-containing protein
MPQAISFEYDYGIVAISIAIAVFASFISYDICLRARTASGSMRSVWIAAAAIAAGGGIWSMHFIGMLAMRMPMSVTYDFWWTFVSLILPILVTGIGFTVALAWRNSAVALLAGGAVVGTGVIVMHFLGMMAMRMDATITHDPFLAGLAVVLAVVLSTAALFIAFKPSPSPWLAAAGAVVMGIAISSMHYTAMAACRMVMTEPHGAGHAAAPIPVSLLAFAIFATLSAALLLVLFASRLDRNHAEEVERRSNEAAGRVKRFRDLLTLSSDLISPLDSHGRFIGEVMSAQRLLGYGPGELTGRKFIDLLPAEDRAGVRGWLLEAEVGNQPPTIQCRILAKSGAHIPCECRAVKVDDPDSGWAIVISARDLTERQRIETRLNQFQRLEALGQMASGVAHDYNNLLTAVSLNLETVERRLPSSDVLEHLRLAQQALTHGNSLTKQLLAFARQQKVEPEPLDLNAVVRGIDQFIKMSLSSQVSVDLDLSDELWPCMADRGMLEAALLNLVVNARDAMPGGGTIRIASGNETVKRVYSGSSHLPDGDYVSLTLTDTGVGMPPDVVARAAEPFFTTKASGKGTGLGLSMVFGFARQFGGDLEIDSAKGQGTTIRILLPRTTAVPMPARTRDAQAEPTTQPGSILLVEDDLAVRYATATLLRERGFVVLDCENAEQALQMPDLDKMDLLITDLHMGHISGLELAELLTARYPGLGVILTSGSSVGSGAGRLEANHRFRHLTKPYPDEALLGEITAVLAERRPAPADSSEILVVDPDPINREKLAALVGNAGFGHCETTGSRDEAVAAAARGHCLVALVGAGPVDTQDGVETGRRLHRDFGVRVILVSSGVAVVPTDYPIDGFLVRSFTLDQLAEKLRSALTAAEGYRGAV